MGPYSNSCALTCLPTAASPSCPGPPAPATAASDPWRAPPRLCFPPATAPLLQSPFSHPHLSDSSSSRLWSPSQWVRYQRSLLKALPSQHTVAAAMFVLLERSGKGMNAYSVHEYFLTFPLTSSRHHWSASQMRTLGAHSLLDCTNILSIITCQALGTQHRPQTQPFSPWVLQALTRDESRRQE